MYSQIDIQMIKRETRKIENSLLYIQISAIFALTKRRIRNASNIMTIALMRIIVRRMILIKNE